MIGFGLTRVTVTFTVGEQALRFAFAGVVPLILGLTLSAFGVALTVGSFDRRYVRTTALWTVIGTTTMFVLALLTLLGSGVDEMGQLARVAWEDWFSAESTFHRCANACLDMQSARRWPFPLHRAMSAAEILRPIHFRALLRTLWTTRTSSPPKIPV